MKQATPDGLSAGRLTPLFVGSGGRSGSDSARRAIDPGVGGRRITDRHAFHMFNASRLAASVER